MVAGKKMNSRNGRRHRRKTDDDLDFRTQTQKRDQVEPVKLKPSPSPVTTEPEPPQAIAKLEENGKTLKASHDNEKTKSDTDAPEKAPILAKETIDLVEETNGNGNGVQAEVCIAETETFAEEDAELEPLVVDSEDSELQFDNISDADSHKGSPVLTHRCATRRSQTRNIPTPKTPKSISEVNGEEKEQAEEAKLHEVVERNEEAKDSSKDAAIGNNKQSQDIIIIDDDVSSEAKPTPPIQCPVINNFPEEIPVERGTNDADKLDASVDSCESAMSTQVNVGSDVTRELDLSLPDENSFLNTAKDLTVVETLRRMSSRRAIRPANPDYRRTLLKAQAEKHEYVLQQQQQQRASVAKVTGTKRKTRSKTPECPKRLKTDTSPGFLSYFTSPISTIRNRFSSGDSMSASTPKLTSYKAHEAVADPELSKIEDSTVSADKKRCIIM